MKAKRAANPLAAHVDKSLLTDALVSLSDASDAANAGQKAARLSGLILAGFAVPEGVVLLVSAYRDWKNLPEDMANALPPEWKAGILEAASSLGYPLAVRSSGLAEDSLDASFAGMYTSVLNVEGPEELERAILQCWQSTTDAPVEAYKQHQQTTERDGAMAVILQKMVPASLAGVAFTADPRTGERDCVLIEAVHGLGDKLVSGNVDAERWSVRADQVRCESGPADVLSAQQAQALAELSSRIAEHQGSPQDIEWAIDGSDIYVLQTRPITGLPDVQPVAIPLEVPPGEWDLETTHFDRPLTPFSATYYVPVYNAVANKAFRESGLPMERIKQRVIGGWVYVGVLPGGGPPPPALVMGLLARLVPGMRGFCRRAREYQKQRLDHQYVNLWYSTWRAELARAIEGFDAVDLSELTDDELGAHFQKVSACYKQAMQYHFNLHPACFLAITDLVFFCRRIPGWSDADSMGLLAGTSTASSEPGLKIAAIARAIESSPEACALFERNPQEGLARHPELAPEAQKLVEDFQRLCGLRTIEFDLVSFTLREHPERLAKLIAGQLNQKETAIEHCARQQKTRQENVERARKALNPADRARFDELLAHAEKTYPTREDSEFWVLVLAGLLRYCLLEVGERMEAREELLHKEHIFYANFDEFLAWFDGQPLDQKRIDKRRGERLWATLNRPPLHLGPGPFPLPDMRYFPKAARRVGESIAWIIENDAAVPQEGTDLRGSAASPGRYTGPARIVHGIDDFDRIRPGDVLVCPITTSAWSIVFGQIGAIVTDAGGMLSHPAIIARECGLPAVLGTSHGTTTIQDGALITVDGSTGTVEVHS